MPSTIAPKPVSKLTLDPQERIPLTFVRALDAKVGETLRRRMERAKGDFDRDEVSKDDARQLLSPNDYRRFTTIADAAAQRAADTQLNVIIMGASVATALVIGQVIAHMPDISPGLRAIGVLGDVGVGVAGLGAFYATACKQTEQLMAKTKQALAALPPAESVRP